jgi:pyochelin biosynthesis protein PchC
MINGKHETTQTLFASYVDGMPTARLVCLPHAGGSPGYFAPWRRHLPSDIALTVAQYPSRDENMTGPATRDPMHLASLLADAMSELTDLPYVLFGHSLGGLLAFELTREMQCRGLRGPRLLCISACKAPVHLPSAFVRRAVALPEADFLHFVGALGGLSPDILDNTELCRIIGTAVRHDFDLMARYRYRPGAPVHAPVALLHGDRDSHLTIDHLLDWRLEAQIEPERHLLAGDHFYLEDGDNQKWVIDKLLAELKPKYGTAII